jgi:hypothetical protein
MMLSLAFLSRLALTLFHCHGPQMRATQVKSGKAATNLFIVFSGPERVSTGWPAFAGHDSFY